jgi:hypothetical protein
MSKNNSLLVQPDRLCKRNLTAKLQARLGLQHRFQVGPLDFVHRVEGVEIDGDFLGRILGQKTPPRRRSIWRPRRWRAGRPRRRLCGRCPARPERRQHGSLLLHQPLPQEVGRDQLQARTREHGRHVLMPRRAGRALEKSGAQFLGLRDGIEGRAIKLLVVVVRAFNDAHRQGRRHEPKQFVRCQHSKSSAYTRRPALELQVWDWQGCRHLF